MSSTSSSSVSNEAFRRARAAVEANKASHPFAFVDKSQSQPEARTAIPNTARIRHSPFDPENFPGHTAQILRVRCVKSAPPRSEAPARKSSLFRCARLERRDYRAPRASRRRRDPRTVRCYSDIDVFDRPPYEEFLSTLADVSETERILANRSSSRR